MSHAPFREVSVPKPAETATYTVENCDDEPIRIPGSIQRHGFLLVLDRRGEHVVAASENTFEFMGVPQTLVLGTALDTIRCL